MEKNIFQEMEQTVCAAVLGLSFQSSSIYHKSINIHVKLTIIQNRDKRIVSRLNFPLTKNNKDQTGVEDKPGI